MKFTILYKTVGFYLVYYKISASSSILQICSLFQEMLTILWWSWYWYGYIFDRYSYEVSINYFGVIVEFIYFGNCLCHVVVSIYSLVVACQSLIGTLIKHWRWLTLWQTLVQ